MESCSYAIMTESEVMMKVHLLVSEKSLEGRKKTHRSHENPLDERKR